MYLSTGTVTGLRHVATSTIDNLASYVHIDIAILTCVVIAAYIRIWIHVSVWSYLPYTISIPHALACMMYSTPHYFVIMMLNKNTWDVKKCGANQKQHCKQADTTKRFDISRGQEVYQIFVTP